ncbi:MAG TPA: hypothetical protein VIG29_22615 [Vicinamibacteria bacterium]|jgi:hypothetical protein
MKLHLLGLVVLCVPDVSGQTAREWPVLEAVLETGSVVKIEELGSGANRPLKVTLEKDGRTVNGLWKPIKRGPREETWESYQAEVAAYELDKMLMLRMVPPTVEREIRGLKGSLQLWLDGYRRFDEARADVPGGTQWDRTLSRMKIFDNLISNWARSDRDFMVDADWNVVLIDHSQAFLSTQELSSKPEQVPAIFDKGLMERLRSLQADSLSMRFGRVLLEPQVRAILSRRDALLTLMEKLIAEKGESAVLF